MFWGYTVHGFGFGKGMAPPLILGITPHLTTHRSFPDRLENILSII